MEGSGSEDQPDHALQLAGHMVHQQSAGETDCATGPAASDTARQTRTSTLGICRVPTARKDEVQRVLAQCLVIKCDPEGICLAPVVILGGEESNIYTLLERHFKDEYLVGGEKFWRLVRTDMQLETWRPRVQGTQLKALAGARLPETETELENISRVAQSLQDCLKGESSPQLFMQDLRITITQIQAWWENRNRRPDGGLKRGAPTGPQPVGSKKRATSVGALAAGAGANAAFLGGLQLLGVDGQQLLNAAANLLPQQPLLQQHGQAGGAWSGMAVPLTSFGAMGTSGFADVGAADDGDLGTGGGDLFRPNGYAGPSTEGMFDHNPLHALFNSPDATAPLVLDVGGDKFRTTLHTLVAAQGSIFWQLVQGQGPAGSIQRLPSGDLFIDRSGRVFGYILEYLRACANKEASFPLPNDARELQALAREASFYQLPVLLDHINNMFVMPQPGTQVQYDTLYLETGYKAIEGPELAETEKAKILMMQQLNHMILLRGQQGFYVDKADAGVLHRTQPASITDDTSDQDLAGGDGASSSSTHQQLNMYFHVLLKRVVPLFPESSLEMDDGGEEEEEMQEPATGDGTNMSGAED